MTDTLKILAQLVPSANVLTTFYTVPGATTTAVSSLSVCNQGVVGTSFNLSVAVNGAADDPKQYIFWAVPLDTNDTFGAQMGLTLGAGDVVRVLASTANISFNLFGVQTT